MDHRMTFTSNPRIVLLFIVVVAMFAVSVAGFVSLGLLYGFIFLALALFLAYQFGKFALAHARSLITTSDEGIRFRMPTTEQESFLWEKVSCSGYCTQARGKPFLFLYNESDDRLITVPREYSDFDSLIERVRAATPFESYSLSSGETIQDVLRRKLGIDGEMPSRN